MTSGAFGSVETYTWLRSMYNWGKGAKIGNASWGVPYRAYSARCWHIDRALARQYNDIALIVSAGNEGKQLFGGSYRTIGDPGSCKNTLAGRISSSQCIK